MVRPVIEILLVKLGC